MICTTCHGERWKWETISNGRARVPCPDCLGGEMHCCEGLTAQNDPPVPAEEDTSLGS